MPSISRLLLGTTCAVLLLACETAAGPGARIAISVAPLALDGIGAARYRLTVVNADDTIVWSAELDSGATATGPARSRTSRRATPTRPRTWSGSSS